MKKYSLRLILACMAMLVMGVTEVRAEMYYVSSAKEFIKHWKANHSICIVADIDLSSFDEDDQCEKYTAELWSKREDEKALYYSLKNIPEMLAVKMEGAYIHNIAFQKCKPDWDDGLIDTNYGTALLARYSKKNTFKDIDLIEIELDGCGFQDASSYGACLVCHDEESTFTKINALACKVFCDGPDAGTLVGEANGSTFDSCNVYPGCAVYAEGNLGNSLAGGLVGMAEDCKFTDCNNTALVTGPQDQLGGIVGKGIGTQFIRCNNYGSVKHGKFTTYDQFSATVRAMSSCAPLDFTSDELEKLTNDPSISKELADNFISAYAAIFPAMGNAININMQHDYYQALHKIARSSEGWSYFEDQYDIISNSNTNLNKGEVYERIFENLNNGSELEKTSFKYELKAYNEAKKTYSKVGGNCMKIFGIIMTVYTVTKMVYDAQDPDEAGGIAGYMEGGSAKACCNYGYVYSADAYAGGIVGKAESGATIKNCLNHGCVKGYEQTGGIVGLFDGKILSTCLNVGNVNAGNSSNTTFGRIYGEKSSDASVCHNYFSSDHYDSSNTTCAGVTQQMLASGQTTMLLNQYDEDAPEEPVWRQTLEYDNFPTVKPYNDVVTEARGDISPIIRTKNANNFIQAIANPFSNIVLTGDIELNTSLANFSSQYMPFVGSIDGQGHRLKNMNFVASTMNKGGLFNNDNQINNVGLFSVAKGATFKNLELCDFGIAITSLSENCGLLVGKSNDCTYDNIRITGGSRITASQPLYKVGGLVGLSNNDTFTDCTTGRVCKFESISSPIVEEIVVGGLVGEAHNSSFLRCINQATVTGDDDVEGGIVAQAYNCTLDCCLNTGAISGCEYLGGIVGYAEDTEIHQCANTGLIKCTASLQESEVGGIVGRYAKDNANKALYECANWGNVYYSAGEGQGGIYGDTSGSPSVHDNYYCFQTESGDYTDGCVDPRIVLTGEWTFNYNSKHSDIYYQDIDNSLFGTHYPVPVKAAGEVYRIRSCKEADSWTYTNRYATSLPHEKELNKFGLCSKCGAVYEAPQDIEILDGFDLVDLAYATNKGQNYANSFIHVERDIDMSLVNPVNNLTPIGTKEHPFSGTFDGNYHTIKNLVIEQPATELGLFSNVTGTTTIRNLIMDNTCALRSSLYGAGGFVGCTRKSTTLTLSHCGFEGFVSGYRNVGTMLGGVFSSDGATVKVNIDHCYNTGTVKGDTESGSFCGYAGTNAKITCSWNSGTVTGYTPGYPMAGGTSTTDRAYDTNTTNEKRKITTDDIESGRLAYLLNGSVDGYGNGENEDAWYQKIGEDAHPMLTKRGDGTDLVYMHDGFSYCDAPNDNAVCYNNSSDAITGIIHDYDEDGFCHRAEGEEHYEPAVLDGDTWKISNMGNLYYVAEEVNSGKEQHDIALENDVKDNNYVIVDGALNTDNGSFRQWTPIGTYNVFTKSFDGNYHTISGLYSNPTENTNDVVGLFAQISGNSSISKVGITNSYFNAKYAGAIAGVANASETNYPRISHCYASDGTVNGTIVGGGIVGEYISGVVETSDFTAPITDCYNTCTVSVASDEVAKNFGGILGRHFSENNPMMTANCYYLDGCTTGTANYGEAKSELAFRLGEVCNLLEKGKWSQTIGKQQQFPAFGQGGVSYARKVNPNSWGSLVLPFPVTSDENVQYYTFKYLSGSDETAELHLNKASTVPANTPCFFRTSANCSVLSAIAPTNSVVAPSSSEVKVEVNTWDDESMYLIGSYDDITVNPQDMILNYFVAQNKLWWGERAFNLGAYRAYIQVNYLPFSAKSITFVVDDDETGIKQISPLESKGAVKLLENGKIVILKNGVKYNAAGQRIL